MQWLLTQAGEIARIDCATEPVDRIGTRPFDPNVTMASTPGRWNGGRSSLC